MNIIQSGLKEDEVSAEGVLKTMKVNGKKRKVTVYETEDGYEYMYDPTTQEYLGAYNEYGHYISPESMPDPSAEAVAKREEEIEEEGQEINFVVYAFRDVSASGNPNVLLLFDKASMKYIGAVDRKKNVFYTPVEYPDPSSE